MTSQPRYLTTRKFVSGILEGCTYTEVTSVRFEIGRRYSPVYGTSDYVVVEQTALVTDEEAR